MNPSLLMKSPSGLPLLVVAALLLLVASPLVESRQRRDDPVEDEDNGNRNEMRQHKPSKEKFHECLDHLIEPKEVNEKLREECCKLPILNMLCYNPKSKRVPAGIRKRCPCKGGKCRPKTTKSPYPSEPSKPSHPSRHPKPPHPSRHPKPPHPSRHPKPPHPSRHPKPTRPSKHPKTTFKPIESTDSPDPEDGKNKDKDEGWEEIRNRVTTKKPKKGKSAEEDEDSDDE